MNFHRSLFFHYCNPKMIEKVFYIFSQSVGDFLQRVNMSDSGVVDENVLIADGKPRAEICMNRVIRGLHSIALEDQINALEMYEWMEVEWTKNYHVYSNWNYLMSDERKKMVTRILHILATSNDIQIQLKILKSLQFLTRSGNITNIMIDAGGMCLVTRLLLSDDEAILTESLELLTKLVDSGNYGDERDVLLHCSLINFLCYSFLKCQNVQILRNIVRFWVNFFRKYKGDEEDGPIEDVTKVCHVLNHMLQQTEGPLSDETTRVEIFKEIDWDDMSEYCGSFVESGLVKTLAEIVGVPEWKYLDEESLILLCNLSSEEAAAQLMLDGGILDKIYCRDPAQIGESELLILGNLMISSEEIKQHCIQSGVVEFVQKVSENTSNFSELEDSIVALLGNVFQPNSKGVPKKYAASALPTLVQSLKSDKSYVVRTTLAGLAGMTASYEGDAFENVEALMEFDVIPNIINMFGRDYGTFNGAVLMVINNLAYSKQKPILQVLLDVDVLSRVQSVMDSAQSFHRAHFELEIAKLVMWFCIGGFAQQMEDGQLLRSFGVLAKKLRSEKNTDEQEPGQLQIQKYTEGHLVDFGSEILETKHLEDIKELLYMDNFWVFLFRYPEEFDPFREKKLQFLKKVTKTIQELGYRRFYCYYTSHVKEMLERTTFDDTKAVLSDIVDRITSRPEEEEMLTSDQSSK